MAKKIKASDEDHKSPSSLPDHGLQQKIDDTSSVSHKADDDEENEGGGDRRRSQEAESELNDEKPQRMRDLESKMQDADNHLEKYSQAITLNNEDLIVAGKRSSIVRVEDSPLPTKSKQIGNKIRNVAESAKSAVGAELHAGRHQLKNADHVSLAGSTAKNFGIAFLKMAKPIPGLSLVAKMLKSKIGPNKYDIDDDATWAIPLSHGDRAFLFFTDVIAPTIMCGLTYWAALTISLGIPIVGPFLGLIAFVFATKEVISIVPNILKVSRRIAHDIKTNGFSKSTSMGLSESVVKVNIRSVDGAKQEIKFNKQSIAQNIVKEMKFDPTTEKGKREFGSLIGKKLEALQKQKTVDEFIREAEKQGVCNKEEIERLKIAKEASGSDKLQNVPEVKEITDAMLEFISLGPAGILLKNLSSSNKREEGAAQSVKSKSVKSVEDNEKISSPDKTPSRIEENTKRLI